MGSSLVFRPDDSPQTDSACQAWRSLTGRDEPVRVERLVKERNGRPYPKSALFRLVAEGPDGGSIIAKHARTRTIASEARIYGSILPLLSLTAPGFHGIVDEGELSWLFIDEVHGTQFSANSADHCRLALEWLAAFHTGTSLLGLDGAFPPDDVANHASYLRSARSRLGHGIVDGVLSAGNRAALEGTAELLDELNEAWTEIAAGCEGSPNCLVHGDFVSKNVLVDEAKSRLMVFDWENVGWGVPAMDIEYLDSDAYFAAVRETWPAVAREEISFLKSVGVVAHAVGELNAWASGLVQDWADYAAERILPISQRLRAGFEEVRAAL